jgi:hypothetical protein
MLKNIELSEKIYNLVITRMLRLQRSQSVKKVEWELANLGVYSFESFGLMLDNFSLEKNIQCIEFVGMFLQLKQFTKILFDIGLWTNHSGIDLATHSINPSTSVL